MVPADLHARAAACSANSRDQGRSKIPEKVVRTRARCPRCARFPHQAANAKRVLSIREARAMGRRARKEGASLESSTDR